jgi:outer membrane protein assembly factor BamB
MGGMVFGDQFGTIQVNEDTVWAGSVVDRNRTPAPGSLARARELWFKGDVVGAQKIMQDEFMTPEVTRSYQPLCTVGTRWSETFAKIEDFRRSLDLATGVAETTFTADGAKYRCRMFASDADQVIVVRWEALGDKPLLAAVALGRDEVVDGGNGVSDENGIEFHTQTGVAVNGERVYIACADGDFMTHDAITGEVVRRASLDNDLRDVVVSEGRVYVSRFRSAEVLRLDAEGNVERRMLSDAIGRHGGPGPVCTP